MTTAARPAGRDTGTDRVGALLAERNVRLLLGSQLLSALGDGVALVAVSFALLAATGSVASLGLVLGARYVPMAAFLLVGGVVADGVDRRRLMVVSDVARAVAQGGLAVVLLSGSAQLWQCILLQVLYGTAEAFFTPAAIGLVPEVAPAEHLRATNALSQMTLDMSRVVGPAVGGLIVMLAGPAGATGVDAATFVLSAVLLTRLALPNRDRRTSTVDRRMVDRLRAGWREVRARRWLLVWILNFTLFATLTIPAVLVLGPALAWGGLGGVTGWAALTSAFGIGALVGSAVALRWDVTRPGIVLAVMMAVAGLRPALFVSGLGLPVVAAYCYLAGAATSVAGVVWTVLLQRHIRGEALSRVGSLDEFGTALLTPLGYVVAQPLAAAVGMRAGMLLLAVLPVAASLATVLAPGFRNLRMSAADASLR